jgi:non-specific riboncleoside hydrolase
MEGYHFVEHQRQPLAKPAFQAIRDVLMASPEPVTLVAIGPLTNIALLLSHYPECQFNIRRLVMMGGSAGRGNFTPNAEFNIAIDPEAAARVFESGLEIVMCGLDVTNHATLTPDYLATLPREIKPGKCCMPCLATTAAAAWRPGYVCTISARLPGWCARTFLP